MPGNAAVPAVTARTPVMVPPANDSSPRLVLASVPIVIQALLAALRCFSSPVVVSAHHW